MDKIVLATGNQGKLVEMQSLLVDLGHQIVSQQDFGFEEALEDGLSFVENAIIKARHAATHTGLPSLADDSGLAVDALGAEPGIFSARYAGAAASAADNRAKLLKQLKGHEERSARFHCALVFMQHPKDPCPLIVCSQWEGKINLSESGAGGFGYDSIFFIPQENCTAAQLSPERKNALSHRGQALREFKQRLVLQSQK